MTNSFQRKSNDLGVAPKPPSAPTKPRVPLAEDAELQAKIGIQMATLNRPQGWKTPPSCLIKEGRKLAISGQASLKSCPEDFLSINTEIVIPALENTSAIIKRDDYLNLIGVVAEVGIEHDPGIGVSFRYREPVSGNILTTPSGVENSKRLRFFWLLALSSNPITVDTFLNSTSLETNGDRRLAIINKTDSGFLISPNLRLWALDTNWSNGLAYTILPEFVEVIPVTILKRVQNFTDDGYTQGFNGEEIKQNIVTAIGRTDPGTRENVLEKLLKICQGIPGKGKSIKTAIINLSAGQASGNPGRVGIAASSPNGSYAIGNDQRVTFSNQGTLQLLHVELLTASNAAGRGRLAIGLNTNAPIGTTFSPNKSDHRIYTLNGTEESALGTFSNLGGNGSLQWVAGENSTIRPGSPAFFAPGLIFPPGSGLSIPFISGQQAWQNGSIISQENVRSADDDLQTFAVPANGESFIVILHSARNSIQYIYKLVRVTSDENGVLTIPLNERGCFAFIEGYQGRIEPPSPVFNAQPGQSFQALIYYAPRSQETWQFQFTYPEYQGVGHDTSFRNFLDGATITSQPIQMIHTQGGGLSVHETDSILRDMCISMNLPRLLTETIKTYDFDAPVYLPEETYNGPVTYRVDIPPLPATNLAFPMPGQKIRLQTLTTSNDRSINSVLTCDGKPMGYRAPILASRNSFQSVLAFSAFKDEKEMLVLATHNCHGTAGEDIVLDPRRETAIDLFEF